MSDFTDRLAGLKSTEETSRALAERTALENILVKALPENLKVGLKEYRERIGYEEPTEEISKANQMLAHGLKTINSFVKKIAEKENDPEKIRQKVKESIPALISELEKHVDVPSVENRFSKPLKFEINDEVEFSKSMRDFINKKEFTSIKDIQEKAIG